MKYRAITFTLAACLASSLAFADSPTDAPLMPNNENPTATQPNNCVKQNQRHPSKKAASSPAEVKRETSSATDRRSNPKSHDQGQSYGAATSVAGLS